VNDLTQSLAVGGTAAEQLYERNAGRVFAYCFVRVGSQSMAEWAVTATFDRARAALANGGLPEQELDWLLRTADKFCAPRLRLREGALPGSGALVLDDWDGLTFDQIVSRLEASREALERARGELSPWRRILGAFNLAPLVAWLKAAFTGTSAVQTAAAVVAVTGAVVVVATPVGDRLHAAVMPPSKPKPATPTSEPSDVAGPGHAPAGGPATTSGAAQGDRPARAAVKAEVNGHPQRPIAAQPGADTSLSPASSSGPDTSPPPSRAGPQAGQPSGSSIPPPGGSAAPTPTVPAASVPDPDATLPLETPTVDSPPLPAPPPTPDTSSLPDPGGEVPDPPALPVDTPTVVPGPAAPPIVLDQPKLPDPPQLP
jgi:hypothetical protein